MAVWFLAGVTIGAAIVLFVLDRFAGPTELRMPRNGEDAEL